MTEEPWTKHTPGDPMPCKCKDSRVEVIFHTGVLCTGPAWLWEWRKIPRSPRSEITDWRFVERRGEDVIQRCGAPQPAPVMQYYYKENACPAEDSRAETCICWHDEGKGPFPDLKNGDAIPMAYCSDIALTWRTAPQPALTDPYPALEWDEDDTAIVPLKSTGRPEWVRDDDLVRFGRGSEFTSASGWAGAWSLTIAFQIKRRPVLTHAEPQLLAVLSVATDDEADAVRSAARRANIEVPE